MITKKIIGTAVLTVCVLLPVNIIFISSLIKAIKYVIKFGDLSGLFFVFWLIAVVGSWLWSSCILRKENDASDKRRNL